MIGVDKCATCAFRANDNQGKTYCMRAKWPVNIAEDGCTKHKRSVPICDYCGNMIINNGQLVYSNHDNKYRVICADCYQHLGHCPTCENAQKTCNFQDPSFEPSIPPQIQKQIRQGPSILVTTVMNPERIEKTCKKCQCWDPAENACGRQNNYCNKYKEI